METAELLAHSLKGTSATIGADKIKYVAENLQHACKGNELQNMDTFLKEVAKELEIVISAIKKTIKT